MRIGLLAIALGSSACVEPVIDMALVLPKPNVVAMFDTTCVNFVEARAFGKHYPGDSDDFTHSCIPIAGAPATLTDVHAAIRGKMHLDIPESGLGGVQIFGTSGGCYLDEPADNELLFYGNTMYPGQGSLVIGVDPNQSCRREPVKIRPIDLLALVTTRRCESAGLADGDVALATLSPDPFKNELLLEGGVARGQLDAGVARLASPTAIGDKSCLTIYAANSSMVSVACRQKAPACAASDEIEAPVMDQRVVERTVDPGLRSQYAIVIGAVYGANGPMQGATVATNLDEDAKIVYLDVPPSFDPASDALQIRSDNRTGPSGLFIVYTNQFANLTVFGATPGTKTTLKVAATKKEFPGEWRYFQRLKPSVVIVTF